MQDTYGAETGHSTRIERSRNQLVYDEGTRRTFAAISRMTQEGAKVLCITTKFPPKMEREFGLKGCIIHWLTDSGDAKDALRPKRLDFEVTRTITSFVRDNRDAVVFLDGYEYLVTENGFDAALKFVKKMTDTTSMHGGAFIVPVNPGAFTRENLILLSKQFDDIVDLRGGPAPGEAQTAEPSRVGQPDGRTVAEEKKAVQAQFNDGLAARADSLERAGKLDEALALVSEALALDVGNVQLWHRKGLILHRLGKLPEALQALDVSVQMSGSDPQAWFNRGLLLLAMGDEARALDCFERTLTLHPKHRQALVRKGALLMRAGRPNDAVRTLDKALELEPSDKESQGLRREALELVKKEIMKRTMTV